MAIDLPDELAAALKLQANARGLSAAGYAGEVLERDLAPALDAQPTTAAFETGRGLLARYGPAPSAEEMDGDRADMFSRFGTLEDF